jgi:hypothetical protein
MNVRRQQALKRPMFVKYLVQNETLCRVNYKCERTNSGFDGGRSIDFGRMKNARRVTADIPAGIGSHLENIAHLYKREYACYVHSNLKLARRLYQMSFGKDDLFINVEIFLMF